jgi:hypothetical protein
MQMRLVSVTVDDQETALGFYTGKLGFVKRADIAIGPIRWLTVSSPEGAGGVELLLEKMDFPPSQIYQQVQCRHSSRGIHFERHSSGVEAPKGGRRQIPWGTAKYGADHVCCFRGRLRQPRSLGSACGLSSVRRTRAQLTHGWSDSRSSRCD